MSSIASRIRETVSISVQPFVRQGARLIPCGNSPQALSRPVNAVHCYNRIYLIASCKERDYIERIGERTNEPSSERALSLRFSPRCKNNRYAVSLSDVFAREAVSILVPASIVPRAFTRLFAEVHRRRFPAISYSRAVSKAPRYYACDTRQLGLPPNPPQHLIDASMIEAPSMVVSSV